MWCWSLTNKLKKTRAAVVVVLLFSTVNRCLTRLLVSALPDFPPVLFLISLKAFADTLLCFGTNSSAGHLTFPPSCCRSSASTRVHPVCTWLSKAAMEGSEFIVRIMNMFKWLTTSAEDGVKSVISDSATLWKNWVSMYLKMCLWCGIWTLDLWITFLVLC